MAALMMVLEPNGTEIDTASVDVIIKQFKPVAELEDYYQLLIAYFERDETRTRKFASQIRSLRQIVEQSSRISVAHTLRTLKDYTYNE